MLMSFWGRKSRNNLLLWTQAQVLLPFPAWDTAKLVVVDNHLVDHTSMIGTILTQAPLNTLMIVRRIRVANAHLIRNANSTRVIWRDQAMKDSWLKTRYILVTITILDKTHSCSVLGVFTGRPICFTIRKQTEFLVWAWESL